MIPEIDAWMECPAKAFTVRQMLGRKKEWKQTPSRSLTDHPPTLSMLPWCSGKENANWNQRGSVSTLNRYNSTHKKMWRSLSENQGRIWFSVKPTIDSWSLKKEQAHFLLWWMYKPTPRSTFSFEGRGRRRSVQGTESRVKEWRNNWQLQTGFHFLSRVSD